MNEKHHESSKDLLIIFYKNTPDLQLILYQ